MARSTARAAVMQMIFEKLAGGEGGEETLAMVYEALRHEGLPGVEIAENEPNKSDKAYIARVLDGVLNHLDELDAEIQAASPRWNVSRMPKVDLTILRLAALPSTRRSTWQPAIPSRPPAALSTACWAPSSARRRRRSEARRHRL